ncbi:MAG TPA: hypothetical protein VNW06_11220 [Cytophagaceae bacterium]|nr:hypothetical protein [Cytophagaceae bacterium]
MMSKRKSNLIRIWSKDIEKLDTIQMLLSIQRGKILTRVEVLHKLLDKSLDNIINEVREHKVVE